jgi:hypothetical protein
MFHCVQETVPGHATMFGFEPKKMEYEVVDISNGQITAMTADGQEKFFSQSSGERSRQREIFHARHGEPSVKNVFLI